MHLLKQVDDSSRLSVAMAHQNFRKSDTKALNSLLLASGRAQ